MNDKRQEPEPATMAWALLTLAALAWVAAAVIAIGVVPARTRLPADVGIDLALPTVVALNASALVIGYWFLFVGAWAAGVAAGGALASKIGARGWLLALFGAVLLAGTGASVGMLWAMELPESTYVRQLEGAGTSAARAAIPRTAAEDPLALESIDENGVSLAATRVRLDVATTATVEQLNALLRELDAIVVAGDPDAGWLVVRVESAANAVLAVGARGGVATAARVRLGPEIR